MRTYGITAAILLVIACGADAADPSALAQRELATGDLDSLTNPFGAALSATTLGDVDRGHPFFQQLGGNGRSCGTCHQAAEGWSLTPAGIKARFEASGGSDPLFLPHDAAVAPRADVSSVQSRRRAYALLLDRGVFRVGLPLRPTFEFELVAVDDPHGHASAAQLSMFRRPLPITNVRFLTAVNWDGRNTPAADLTNIALGLRNQANGATINHAQASGPLSEDTRAAIAAFQVGLATTQVWHRDVGFLDAAGGLGGPELLLAASGEGNADGRAFTLYDAWADSADDDWKARERREVYEGQALFNDKVFAVTGAAGLSDGPATCATCHDQPNVGGATTFRMIDIGISNPDRRDRALSLYTFRHKVTGEELVTTDPGRALVTGLWADMNRFKVPALRALAARAPYFHDGSARTIADVVTHYRTRFGIAFSPDEERKLIKFLEAL